MKKIKFYQIDSFTKTQFTGNSTAVIMDASLLSVEQMKKIAREMNFSETAFILPSKNADFRLKYYTPNGSDIKFCGHATIGALHAIHLDGSFGTKKPGIHHLKIENDAGIFDMSIDNRNTKEPTYSMTTPQVALVTPPYTLPEVLQALAIPENLIRMDLPLLVDPEQNYVYFAAKSLQALGQIKISQATGEAFAQKHGVVLFCPLAEEAFDSLSHLHSRSFGPAIAVPEDPFTGSMQGGSISYARLAGFIAKDQTRVVSEQGHFMDRPGSVICEILQENPIQVRLLAHAVHNYSAEMELR